MDYEVETLGWAVSHILAANFSKNVYKVPEDIPKKYISVAQTSSVSESNELFPILKSYFKIEETVSYDTN